MLSGGKSVLPGRKKDATLVPDGNRPWLQVTTVSFGYDRVFWLRPCLPVTIVSSGYDRVFCHVPMMVLHVSFLASICCPFQSLDGKAFVGVLHYTLVVCGEPSGCVVCQFTMFRNKYLIPTTCSYLVLVAQLVRATVIWSGGHGIKSRRGKSWRGAHHIIEKCSTDCSAGAPVMDENTQPQVHVRCSDVNAVCEARKLVSFHCLTFPYESAHCLVANKKKTNRTIVKHCSMSFIPMFTL